MYNIIYVFGPSCSGKSSLAQALQEDLGNDWSYLDRDDLIEQKLCSEEDADKFLEAKITKNKNKWIIDTQIP